MKKSVLIAAGIIAVGLTSSYGQGYIDLGNYFSTANPLITYGAGVPSNGQGGALGSVGAGLNSSWTVGLYFVAGTVAVGESAGTGIPNAQLALGTGGGSTAQVAGSSVFGNAGQFDAGSVFYVGSAATTVTLEVVAFDSAASSYATAAYRGHSASFTMPTGKITDTTPQYVGDNFASFSVAAVPEPTTLALAGLGGFGMLMALRRKQA